MTDTEKLILLFECCDINVDSYKLDLSAEYMSHPLLHDLVTKDVATIYKNISEFEYFDKEEVAPTNPLFYYNKDVQNTMSNIDDFKFTHTDLDKEYNFNELFNDPAIERRHKEDIAFDVFEDWITDYKVKLKDKLNLFSNIATNINFDVISKQSKLKMILILIMSLFTSTLLMGTLNSIPYVGEYFEMIYDGIAASPLANFFARISFYFSMFTFVLIVVFNTLVKEYSLDEKNIDTFVEQWNESIDKVFVKQNDYIERFIDDYSDGVIKEGVDISKFSLVRKNVFYFENYVHTLHFRISNITKYTPIMIQSMMYLSRISYVLFILYMALAVINYV